MSLCYTQLQLQGRRLLVPILDHSLMHLSSWERCNVQVTKPHVHLSAAQSTKCEIWFYTKLSTSALTNVLRILTTEAPVAHRSARHSQRRSAELTCSSSQKPTIVHARFVQHNLAASSKRPYPLSPCRERQAERASHEQRSSSEGTKVFCAAALVGAAPNKFT
jgi:hypothetical protein